MFSCCMILFSFKSCGLHLFLFRVGILVFRMGIVFTDGLNVICLFLYQHFLGCIHYFYCCNNALNQHIVGYSIYFLFTCVIYFS